jgi:ABC-type nitrate/sulfonate/bicarbonate transport system substrate-binding protein
MFKRSTKIALIIALSTTLLMGLGQAEAQQKLTKVKVLLDYIPNTNHTGLYVAKAKGYFKAQGLDVTIAQPGDSVETLVATGKADFGVSYQEQVTLARVSNVPVKSIGAIIQHNTSAFASLKSKNIKTAKDWEGKTYGGWGSASEKATIQSIMQAGGADFNKLKMLDSGYTDFFKAIKKDIDFAWIYYGWDGINAKINNIQLNYQFLNKMSSKLDYYTPLLIASDKTIKNNPKLVKAFMTATAQGYNYSIQHPDAAANVLLKAAPDLDPKLVKASQKWLAAKYKDDANYWGQQKKSVWTNYATWMYDNKLLPKKLDASAAYTNAFLPKK